MYMYNVQAKSLRRAGRVGLVSDDTAEPWVLAQL